MGGGSIGGGGFEIPTTTEIPPVIFKFNIKIKTVNSAGVAIQDLQIRTNLSKTEVGVTDKEGIYNVQPFSVPGVSNALVSFTVTDKAGFQLTTGEKNISSLGSQDITITLDRYFVVFGKAILESDKSPLPNLKIEATDKLPGLFTSLALVTETNGLGTYEIRFWTHQLAAQNRVKPNLVIRVYNPNGDLIDSSEVREGKGLDEINFSIKADIYGGPSEFDRFYKSILPSLASIQQGGIDANDLVLLSNMSGGDISQMNHLMDAIQLSDAVTGVGVEAEWLYGFFRRGLPSNKGQLANMLEDRKKFDAVILDAVDLKIISNNVFAEKEKIYAQLIKFKVSGELSSYEDPEMESMLGFVLRCSGLDAGKQAALYFAYIKTEKKDDSFWTKAFTDGLINKEQLIMIPLYLKLAFVCERERGIFEVLLLRYNPSHILDLARLGYTEWFSIVQEARSRKKIENIHPDEDFKLVLRLLNRVYDLIPTAVLLNLIKKEEVISDNAWHYIEDIILTFDFKDQNINAYIDLYPETLENYKNDVDSLRKSLNRIQRTFLLAPANTVSNSTGVYSYRPVIVKALLDLNLDSAGKILRVGELTFVKYYREGLQLDILSENEREECAKLVFQRARKQANLIRHLHSTYGTSFNNLPMYALPQNEDRYKTRVHIPGLSTLFEAQEIMTCDHCNSVLSPAAYLVDLLSFLDEAEINHTVTGAPVFNETALNILFDRRPDIQHLVLNCENTNTPLSYVDLVNEVLENAISFQLTEQLPENSLPKYRLRGKVVTPGTAGKPVPVKDAWVQLFSSEATHQQLLGTCKTDRYGKFEIRLIPANTKTLSTVIQVIYQHQSLYIENDTIKWQPAHAYEERLLQVDFTVLETEDHPKQVSYLKGNDIWTLKGNLVSSLTNSALQNYTVMAWDEDYGGDDLLGICQTDSSGNFQINFHSSAYMEAKRDVLPDPYIVVINEGRVIYMQFLGSNIKESLDLATIVINPKNRNTKRISSSSHGFSYASGVVKGTNNLALAGLQVVLTNDSLRPENLSATEEFAIGTGVTDKNGNFSISFDENEWKISDKPVNLPYKLLVKANDSQVWTLQADIKNLLPTPSVPATPYSVAYAGSPPATGDRITGKVTNQYNNQPVQGYLIEVWRAEENKDYWIGNAITSAAGEFVIPTVSLAGKTQVDLFFRLFEGDNFLYQDYATTYVVTLSGTQRTVRMDLKNPYFGENAVLTKLMLTGRALDEKTMAPIRNASIAFWEKDKGHDYAGLQFGTRTNDEGYFEINFSLPDDSITGVSRTWYYKVFMKDRISFQAPASFKWAYKEKNKFIEIRLDTSQYSFGMAKEYYSIQGKLTNQVTGQPLRGCNVEAWDKDEDDGDDLLGISKTDINGNYEITFDSHYFRDRIEDNDPDVYFIVYQGTHLLLREDVIADMKTKVLLKDLEATPLERTEVSGQRGPLNGNVYKTLSETLYPWNFPFNLHETEAHLYLKQLGLDKEQLIASLNPGKDTRLGEALAYLQMSREELDSLKTSSVKLLYGLGDDVTISKLNDIPFILSTVRISFETLKELILTDYVNPLKKEIRFLTDRTLLEFTKNEYLNLHRLSRIQAKCGWKAKELEQVIRLYEGRYGELKGSTIDKFIIYLAAFKKLLKRGATIYDLLAWQYDLHLFSDEDGEIYFNRIFNRATYMSFGQDSGTLLLNVTGQALADPNQKMLNENVQLSESASLPILASLGLDAASLVTLINNCLPNSKIDLANLSRLYRVISFCKYLGIELNQIKPLAISIGVDPLQQIVSKEISMSEIILNFTKELDFVIRNGFALSDLEFIYAKDKILSWTDDTRTIFRQIKDTCLKVNAEARPTIVTRKFSEVFEMPEDLLNVILSDTILWKGSNCKVMDLLTNVAWLEVEEPQEFLLVTDWLRQWIRMIVKTGMLVKDLEFILQNGADNGWYRPLLKGLQTDTKYQEFTAWKTVITSCQLNDAFRQKNQATIFQLISDTRKWAKEFPEANKQKAALSKDNFFRSLIKTTAWNADDLKFMCGNIHQWEYPVNFLDMKWFERLSLDFKFLLKSGLLPSQIPMMQAVADKNTDAVQTGILQMALKSKMPADQWEEKIDQLKDQVREGQKNALQTYLLSRDPALQSEDDIYAQYLVDTEAGTALQTSRIKQSISSVQLLVQRIRMGLEPGLSLTRENMKEWEWRKNYRVWEANRKIFLYPENWLEPELRDDKSEFFKKFEEELMQGEINAANTEKAFRNFLTSADEVARLEISGFCHQEDGNTYHVFARTRNIPHRYFYRQWVEEYLWTPWEEVQLDIAGDHLIPALWNRKLIVLWPSFTEKAVESNTSMAYDPNSKATVKGNMPLMQVEIKLSMSTRQEGAWTSKKISETKVRCEYNATASLSGDPTYPRITFQTVTTNENLFVHVFRDNTEVGVFVLAAGTNEIMLASNGATVPGQKTPLFPRDEASKFVFSKCPGTSTLKIKNQELLSTAGDFLITAVPEQTTSESALFMESNTNVFVFNKVRSLFNESFSMATSPATGYRFRTFYHPHTGFLKSMLDRYSVSGLFNPPANEDGKQLLNYLKPTNKENTATVKTFSGLGAKEAVVKPYPAEDLSFDLTDAYASYNWELFFHAPISIALRLSQNQRFEEAQQWFHHIFDPTETEGVAPRRFWRIKPFYLFEDYSNVNDIIKALGSDKEEYTRQVENWEKTPLNPHVIARLRIVAYMRMVVMKYIDNLVDWGDYLFRQDTSESINEAIQIYILAAQVLGKRPAFLKQNERDDLTIEDIFENLDNFSNALIETENKLPNIDFKDIEASSTTGEDNPNIFGSLLYFCIPQNDQLLSYWEIVADRLYKIRQGMNIDGVKRALALFEPPIDPGMLMKAAAKGQALAATISEGHINPSTYRFTYLLPKAIEFCNEVKFLGAGLLSALEKKDAEEMAQLRSTHEVSLLKAVKEIKKKSIEEAGVSIQSLKASMKSARTKLDDYNRRIDDGNTTLENAQIALAVSSLGLKWMAAGMGGVSIVTSFIPNFLLGLAGVFGSPVAQVETDAGKAAAKAAAKTAQAAATAMDQIGGIISTFATWQRREEEWQLQKDLAEVETEQIQYQINGALLREESAHIDLKNHEQQIIQAQEVRDLMEGKYTNLQLYQWMTTQLATVYFQAYQLAYDLAKKAENAYAYELGIEQPKLIEFGYWDTLKKGLMAGEKLQLDLRRLELAYMEQNKRESELTKHISMSLFNARALLDLREKGVCEFQIPEILFDLDHSSHYMRRIRSVSLTIPCITGPYTGVHAKLTLLKSRTRKTVLVEKGYEYKGPEDLRFNHEYGGIQSISTSSAQNDSGVFELNFRDERYLPFERAGTISTWRLELPAAYRQFNYDSISDVIFHLNYTARDGGEVFKKSVEENIKANLNAVVKFFAENKFGLQLWLNLRTDFSTAFNRLLNMGGDVMEIEIQVTPQHLPYFLHDCELTGKGWTILVKCKDNPAVLENVSVRIQAPDKATIPRKTFSEYPGSGQLKQAYFKTEASPIGKWKIWLEPDKAGKLNSDTVEEIWLVNEYNVN